MSANKEFCLIIAGPFSDFVRSLIARQISTLEARFLACEGRRAGFDGGQIVQVQLQKLEFADGFFRLGACAAGHIHPCIRAVENFDELEIDAGVAACYYEDFAGLVGKVGFS
jgi:hypothetical protein